MHQNQKHYRNLTALAEQYLKDKDIKFTENNKTPKKITYPASETLRRLTDPPVLPRANPHNVGVDSTRYTVLHLCVQLGKGVAFIKHNHEKINQSNPNNLYQKNELNTITAFMRRKKIKKKLKRKLPS